MTQKDSVNEIQRDVKDIRNSLIPSENKQENQEESQSTKWLGRISASYILFKDHIRSCPSINMIGGLVLTSFLLLFFSILALTIYSKLNGIFIQGVAAFVAIVAILIVFERSGIWKNVTSNELIGRSLIFSLLFIVGISVIHLNFLEFNKVICIDENTIYYLFSSIIQGFAALLAIGVALMTFGWDRIWGVGKTTSKKQDDTSFFITIAFLHVGFTLCITTLALGLLDVYIDTWLKPYIFVFVLLWALFSFVNFGLLFCNMFGLGIAPKKRVFIIHSGDGSQNEGWFLQLKKMLEAKGFAVKVPSMPESEAPDIKKWVSFLSKEMGKADKDTFLVGHNRIGCQTVLRYLQTTDPAVGGTVLVACWTTLTPGAIPGKEEKRIAKPWLDASTDFDKVKKNAGRIVAVFSNDDPYVKPENSEIFKTKLGAEIIIEKDKGHFSGGDKAIEILEKFLGMAKTK